MSTTSSESNDNSRPATPPGTQPSSLTQIPTIKAPDSLSNGYQLDLASTLRLPSSPESSSKFLSPTLAPSRPQHVFTLSDLLKDVEGGLEALGPDFANAEVTVAAGGSFIETSSGPAARELKRRYDQLAGVSLSVRSPYAITAFVNQHGKSMYRIGHRDEHSAPAASAAGVEERIAQSKTSGDTSQSPRTKRRSRLSMHIFNKSTTPAPPSRPPTATTASPRKLQRKTRSIPDLSSAALEQKAEKSGVTSPTFGVTGRGHSQSVTAVDIPRPNLVFHPPPPERKIDAFAELMDWFTPSSSASSNFSTHSLFRPGKVSTDPVRPRAAVVQPFGPSVTFNSPSQKTRPDRLPPPRHLRVMQSFESGLTARQDDARSGNDSPMSSESDHDHDLNRPPSAIRLSQMTSSSDSSDHREPPPPELDQNISPESLRLSSHYSTEVFNVLQTYRGLPLFDALVPEVDEGTTVIKLSLAADSSAAPRDDPRFVIWGETMAEYDQDDYHSTSRDSLTDLSSSNPSSSMSKKRSSKVSKLRSPEASTSRLPPVEPTQKVLLAATIERWIAQLTSDLNYDELLNFFLTYRTYVSAVDLCHLLICRFHWALLKPSSREDETVRRIVRVRTFVAIRYWLLTFFTVDFIPNRELRLLIADWLNALLLDPILKQHNDGVGIVRRLTKVAKECKRAHTRTVEKPKPTSPPRSAPETPSATDHVLGKSFAEAIRKPPPEDDESDLDLDFLPDDANPLELPTLGFPSDPANAHLTVAHSVGGKVLSPASRPTSLPLSSLTILHRTEHAPGPNADAEHSLLFAQNPGHIPLPIRHSALSRAFVRTIGRLGRWKRVLNPRTSISMPRAPSVPLGPCGAGVSAFDLEIAPTRDLLTTNEGVEKYLKIGGALAGVKPAVSTNGDQAVVVHSPPSAPATSLQQFSVPQTTSAIPLSSSDRGPPSPISPLVGRSSLPSNATTLTPVSAVETASTPERHTPLEFAAGDSAAYELPPNQASSDDEAVMAELSTHQASQEPSFSDEVIQLREQDGAESFRSSSTDSFGAPLTSGGPPPTFPGSHAQWQFDVVSIDDLDFSDTSSIPGGGDGEDEDEDDLAYPPGLSKPSRKKLPMRREFEFVRRSEVSSMGIVSHESMRDSFSSSTRSGSSPSSSGGGPGPIHRWQMKSLQQTFESSSNDEDDRGDVEAALRRLEGQINPKIQQEKAEKVDGWVRTMQERMANGEYEYEGSLFSEDEMEGFIDEVEPEPDFESQCDTTTPAVELGDEEDNDTYDNVEGSAKTPLPTQLTHQVPPGLDTPPRAKDAKPAIEDVVPIEILQSRMPSASTAQVKPSSDATPPSKFADSDTARIHRSFILNHPAETLARHFSMIDRELFMGVKFEELVTEDWVECEEIEVLDWAHFLKDRLQWKAESRFADKTTALAAVRARFNLMVTFVISEVVLTPPTERHHVVGKFVRIAWKSYSLSSFHTLTAIITALRSDWVNKAMRKTGWARIGIFETRAFRDLKQFTTNNDDFKFMRQVIDSIVDAKPMETNSHASSVVSGSASESQSGKGKNASDSKSALPTACIPFIGIYLSQLHRFNKLPALIDPTAPNSVIGIDPITAIFDPPAHPEVFSMLPPLPPSMHLEPLINVHKQRRIADVIKSLVAGQHLASRVQFDVDRKLFQKCLRLRGLDSIVLQRALAMYTD